MSQFEFLSVFLSIVLALGVSDVLAGWGEQIRYREKVRHYWLHSVWAGLYLLVCVQAWWGTWRLRERVDWTFFDNLVLLFPYMLLALLAYVLTPSVSGGQTDIKKYYYRNGVWFFGIGAAYIASLIINTRVALGQPFLDPRNIIRVAAILLLVTLAAWKNELFHKIAAVVAYLLLGLWIGVTLFAI